MPYEIYKIHMRNTNNKKPKRTLTRERRALREKSILSVENNSSDLFIFKNNFKDDTVSK